MVTAYRPTELQFLSWTTKVSTANQLTKHFYQFGNKNYPLHTEIDSVEKDDSM